MDIKISKEKATPLTAENQNSDKTTPAIKDPNNVTPEIGGRKGPEPTRFGDWELNGKCVDF
jgi:hypothetical protein